MLHIENISKTFFPGTINEKRALQNLSLHLKPGDFVTVIGGNGAGKSTMLNAVAGVFPIDSGKIIIDGEEHPIINLYRTFLFFLFIYYYNIHPIVQEDNLFNPIVVKHRPFIAY